MRLVNLTPATLAAAAVTATATAAAASGIPAGGGGAGASGQGASVPMTGGAGAYRLRPEVIQMALMLRHHDVARNLPCYAPLPIDYKVEALAAMAGSRMALAAQGVSTMVFLTPARWSTAQAQEEASLQRSLAAYFFGLYWFRGLPSERRDGILKAMVEAKLRVSALGISLMVVTVPNGLKDPRGIPLPMEVLPSHGLDLGLVGTLEQRYDQERIGLMDEEWMTDQERNQIAVARVIRHFIRPDHDAVRAQ